MTKIAVIGGKLQGTEICYLAQKAGIETLLIDKNHRAPARGICSNFINADIFNCDNNLLNEIKLCDLVIPALENQDVLDFLVKLSKDHEFILAFDEKTYEISSSKLKSDSIFHSNNLPSPKYFPQGEPPYIGKPIFGSGSDGVRMFSSTEEVLEFLGSKENANTKEHYDWIVQEFITGPSYSIEVIGSKGKGYKTYQITEILIDMSFDCNKVNSYTDLSLEQEVDFAKLAVKIAELVGLDGIMDVEVILNDNQLKILEIDARFPSQTPTAIYHSSGINLVSELINHYCEGNKNSICIKKSDEIINIEERRFVCYEHFLIEEGKVKALGEHIMAEAECLECVEGFCDADEAITDYYCRNKKVKFRCTMINIAQTLEELKIKRANMLLELEKLGRMEHE